MLCSKLYWLPEFLGGDSTLLISIMLEIVKISNQYNEKASSERNETDSTMSRVGVGPRSQTGGNLGATFYNYYAIW